MYCKECTIFFKVFKLKWIVCCFLSHLQNGTTILTAPLRDVWWFPQIRIPLGITFATEGWGNWRTKIWWFVMGGGGGGGVDYETHLDSLFAPLSKIPVIACVKVCTSSCKLCILSRKSYPISLSSLVNFAEFFLPLNLYWLGSLGDLFEFFFISAIVQHFLHFLSRSLSSRRFITTFTRRWFNGCRCWWQILLNKRNTRNCTRSNSRSCTDHSNSFTVKTSSSQSSTSLFFLEVLSSRSMSSSTDVLRLSNF